MTTPAQIIHLGYDAGPIAGVVANPPRRRGAQRETHPLVGADVSTIHRALLQAFVGRPAQLHDLFDDMRERDSRVDAVSRTRVLAIQGRPYSVKPARGYEEDKEAVAIAEAVRDLLELVRATSGFGGWRTVVGEIASGVLTGLYVGELEWGISPDRYYYPRRIHWRHPNRFVYNDALEICKADLDDPFDGVPLASFGADKFIVFVPTSGRAAYPTRRGVLLGAVFPSLAKRVGLKLWLKGTERWGQPLATLELPPGSSSPDLYERAKAMLNDMTANFNAVLEGGIKSNIISGTGSLNPDIYEKLENFCNTEIAIQILGNNLNAEIQGGSFAAAKEASAVRYDYLAADVAEIDDAITQQIIEPIVRYNWPGAPCPRYESEIDARAAFERDDVVQGIASEDEYRSSKGWAPKPDGSGADYRPAGGIAPNVSTGPVADPTEQKPGVAQGAQVDDVQQTALNGAQVTSLLEIVQAAAANQIPRETAIALITTAFPVDEAKANTILGPIGQGFVPALDAEESPPEPNAPDAVDSSLVEQPLDPGDLRMLSKTQRAKAVAVVGRVSTFAIERMLAGVSITARWQHQLAQHMAMNNRTLDEALDEWANEIENDPAFVKWHRESGLHAYMAGQLMVRAVELADDASAADVAVDLTEKSATREIPAQAFLGLPFQAAVDFFKAKNIVTPAAFDRVADRYKTGAFTARALASKALRQRAHAAIVRALEQQDLTVAGVIDQIRQDEIALGMSAASHDALDTIVRNAVASSYGHGKWEAMSDPAVAAVRPYVEYATAGDGRVRPAHQELDGKVFAVGSEEAAYYAPPLGHRCRCSLISRGPEYASRVTAGRVPGVDPDPGWEGKPAPVGASE